MSAARRRGACPTLSAPMQTGDGLLARLRPVASGIAPGALAALAEAAARHGNGVLEISARGSLQIRGLGAQSAPEFAQAVDALGIEIMEGVPVETGPLAGLDPDETADPNALAQEIRIAIQAAGLSRRLGPKVSVVVDGGGRFDLNPVIGDVRLTALSDGAWSLATGGNARTARQWDGIAGGSACAAVLAMLEAIAARGRNARGRDLDADWISDEIAPYVAPLCPAGHLPLKGGDQPSSISSPTFSLAGAAETSKRVISPLEGEMSGRTEGGAKGCNGTDRSPIGLIPLKKGVALAVALGFGQTTSAALAALARHAESLGASQFRLAPGRKLLVLGLDRDACIRLQSLAGTLGFITDAADPRLAVVACAGAPACASAHLATKPLARQIAADLTDASHRFHVSGCAKRCAEPAGPAITIIGTPSGCELHVPGAAPRLIATDDAAGAVLRLAERRKSGRAA